MPKKAKPPRTPARLLWGMIEAERHAQSLTQGALAKLAGCSAHTASLDAKDPERIPQARLWLYFAALGIDAQTVLAPVAQAYIAHLTEGGEKDG